jgi:hypothetical protein
MKNAETASHRVVVWRTDRRKPKTTYFDSYAEAAAFVKEAQNTGDVLRVHIYIPSTRKYQPTSEVEA